MSTAGPLFRMLEDDHSTLVFLVRALNNLATHLDSDGYSVFKGLTVGIVGGSRIVINTSTNPPAIEGYDSDDEIRVEYLSDRINFYDSTGSVSEVFSTTTQTYTITVGPGKDFATIQEAVDSLPKFINHIVYIEIYTGTYAENVVVKNKLGQSSVYIRGHAGETV